MGGMRLEAVAVGGTRVEAEAVGGTVLQEFNKIYLCSTVLGKDSCSLFRDRGGPLERCAK